MAEGCIQLRIHLKYLLYIICLFLINVFLQLHLFRYLRHSQKRYIILLHLDHQLTVYLCLSCPHEEKQHQMAPQESHTIPRRGSSDSIRSSGTTGSDGGLWEESCGYLHAAGITTEMLRNPDLRDEIIRVLAESLTSPTPPEELDGEFNSTQLEI